MAKMNLTQFKEHIQGLEQADLNYILLENFQENPRNKLPKGHMDLLLSTIDFTKPLGKDYYHVHQVVEKCDNLKLLKQILILNQKIGFIGKPDENGQTPLIYSVVYHKLEAFQLLLKLGADVNDADNYGISFLDLIRDPYLPIRKEMNEHVMKKYKKKIKAA